VKTNTSYSTLSTGISTLEILIAILICLSCLTLGTNTLKITAQLNKKYQILTESSLELELAKSQIISSLKKATSYYRLDSIELKLGQSAEIILFQKLSRELRERIGTSDCYKIYVKNQTLRRKSLCKKENQPLAYNISSLRIEKYQDQLYQLTLQDTKKNQISFLYYIQDSTQFAELNIIL